MVVSSPLFIVQMVLAQQAGFTASLSTFSEEWRTEVGSGKAIAWPTGVGGKGNSGVAGIIRNTEGAIGYLNYGYVNGGQFQQVFLFRTEMVTLFKRT